MKKIIAGLAVLALVLTGCTAAPKKEETVFIKVGASPAPHAQILNELKPVLEAKGYTLEVIEFTDYVLPNTALDAGELDANYFQHVPYLTDFNSKNGTKLSSVLAVHFEPLGIYPGKSSDLNDITGKTFAIPNDTTNEARALQLLAAQGYLTLNPSAGLEATPIDIIDNPHQLKFIEMEAATLPRALQDVDYAIINGNYALSANIGDTVLLTEDRDSEGATLYANVLVVRTGQETSEKTKALIEAFQSEEIKTYIKETFGDLVVLMFE